MEYGLKMKQFQSRIAKDEDGKTYKFLVIPIKYEQLNLFSIYAKYTEINETVHIADLTGRQMIKLMQACGI